MLSTSLPPGFSFSVSLLIAAAVMWYSEEEVYESPHSEPVLICFNNDHAFCRGNEDFRHLTWFDKVPDEDESGVDFYSVYHSMRKPNGTVWLEEDVVMDGFLKAPYPVMAYGTNGALTIAATDKDGIHIARRADSAVPWKEHWIQTSDPEHLSMWQCAADSPPWFVFCWYTHESDYKVWSTTAEIADSGVHHTGAVQLNDVDTHAMDVSVDGHDSFAVVAWESWTGSAKDLVRGIHFRYSFDGGVTWQTEESLFGKGEWPGTPPTDDDDPRTKDGPVLGDPCVGVTSEMVYIAYQHDNMTASDAGVWVACSPAPTAGAAAWTPSWTHTRLGPGQFANLHCNESQCAVGWVWTAEGLGSGITDDDRQIGVARSWDNGGSWSVEEHVFGETRSAEVNVFVNGLFGIDLYWVKSGDGSSTTTQLKCTEGGL